MIKKFTLAVFAALACLTANAQVTSVDDLVGTYTPNATGYEFISATGWTSMTKDYEVTIEKNTDGTVQINNLLDLDDSFVGTVDLTKKTITIAPQTFATYYTFASGDSTDVVAKISDNGTITFDDIDAYYSKYTYLYEPYISLTKKVPATVDWTADGTLYYYNGDELYHSAKGTITKYSGVTTYEYGVKLDGEDASPAEILFSYANDSVAIANGLQYTGYSGAYFNSAFEGNYTTWFDTTVGYSSFAGTQDGGTFMLYFYAYSDDSYTNYVEGQFYFKWGTEDGIKTVNTQKTDANAPIYDLAGRKVTSAKAPGVYICNGRKFVVK